MYIIGGWGSEGPGHEVKLYPPPPPRFPCFYFRPGAFSLFPGADFYDLLDSVEFSRVLNKV